MNFGVTNPFEKHKKGSRGSKERRKKLTNKQIGSPNNMNL